MSDTMSRVSATRAAREAIAALRTARGPVMFVQSGGCCDGTEPMCFPLGDFTVGDGDVLLGELDGCPFYMDVRLYEALRRPLLVLDVAPGAAGGFSLSAGNGLHFVTRDQISEQEERK